ncbi:hypothetical protein ACE6H2_013639 [Prunus campanulata]
MGKKRNKKTLVWRPKPKSRTPPAEMRNWLDLPRDVTVSILSRLRPVEILESAQMVCMAWRIICKDPLMWRTIDMANDGEDDDMFYNLDAVCRHAVDRSCGRLVDINIEHFGDDDLLEYITDSCGGIRRLRLVGCYRISREGLGKAASKLTLLEELEIYECNLSRTSLEMVGRSCPLLKSFKLNRSEFSDYGISGFAAYDGFDDWNDDENGDESNDDENGDENGGSVIDSFGKDDEALAIAGTMNALHHLQLFGNRLTNDGLRKILDCCPHLESLDLRNCFNIDLKGALGKRCAERIKQLCLPNDSINDYEFRIAPCDYGFYNDSEDFDCDDDYPYDFNGYYSDDSDFYDDFTKIRFSDLF